MIQRVGSQERMGQGWVHAEQKAAWLSGVRRAVLLTSSQRLGLLENVWAGRCLKVTVGSECLWMVLGGTAVDGALSPEMFLQAPPSLLPGIGYPQLFLSKPSPAQAAMRDVKQPLPPAWGFPPPSQVEDSCLQHVAPVKARMDGS